MAPALLSERSWILLVLLLGVWLPQASARHLEDVQTMEERHERWMARHGRVYGDEEEKKRRLEIFARTVEYVESSNSVLGRQYTLAVNKFADLTIEEFKATHTGLKPNVVRRLKATAGSFMYENVTDVPTSMDWRTKGAVNPVKDQLNCGSCWAFSVVASTEGINQIETGKLISLSEQELVDCDKYDSGCDGGELDTAFKFIVENGGLTTEADYPYLGVDGTCKTGKLAHHAANISGFEDVPENNETALLVTAANQPVSVAIQAGEIDFMLYSGGVFTGPCGFDLDHGVAVVGYGKSDNETEYWLVKNSWGTTWGEEGYIRMERGVAAKQGLCGIAMQASFPTA